MDRKILGRLGENLVLEWYLNRGYTLLAQNYTARFGEIDLIVSKNDVLIFCEVKTRRNKVVGVAAQSVTQQKQLRIIKTAQSYLMYHRLSDPLIRFDVAEVYFVSGSADINIIENAFAL